MSETVADVLRASYYYAMIEERAVEPALLLIAAARNDALIGRPVLGSVVAEAKEVLRRIPSGPGADPSGPGAGVLREAGWWVLRGNDRTGGPRWSDGVSAVLDVDPGRVPDVPALLRAVLDGGHPSVSALLDGVGADQAGIRSRLAAAKAVDDTPFVPLLGLAGPLGVLHERNVALRSLTGLLVRAVRSRPGAGPVLFVLALEATRQAVVAGHPVVQSSAVLLAALSIDEQLVMAGRRLRDEYAIVNLGGEALRRRGVTLAAAQAAAEPVVLEHDLLAADDPEDRFPGGGKPADPPWTVEAGELWSAAVRLAGERGETPGTTHLVDALETVPAPAAQRLLTDVCNP